MSDPTYAFQANFKFGPQYKETLVNVPANTPEEMVAKLEWLTENAAKFVAAHAALQGVAEVPALAANVTSTQVIQQPVQQSYTPDQHPPVQPQTQWGQPQQSPPPWAGQQQAPAAQGPTCQHGPMVHRSGTSAKGAWSGYFCPTPKGTPGQCDPQFAPRGRG